MFFMIAVLPFAKSLTRVFLTFPPDGSLQEAEIAETGSRLILFFIPVFTFQKQYEVRFSNGCSGQIEGLSKSEILQANRQLLEEHLVIRQTGFPVSNCPHCGYPLDQDFEYCPKCGTPLNR
ncbi:MAG: zinc ribbon domain-containing protein [Ileibacterium sp.]|nr:zinc ribbon domain-containing protein [Ileibacterium sp.]